MLVRSTQPRFPQRARERGAVLLVALVFLILLTLLAIGASSGSLLQQRMVSATRSAQLATMSGDTALRGAEWNIWNYFSQVQGGSFCARGSIDATNGCVYYDPSIAALYGTAGTITQFRTGNNGWLTGTGITYKGAGGAGYTNQTGTLALLSLKTSNVAQNPQYVIEDMGMLRAPGAGLLHESGVTGPSSGAPGGNIVLDVYRVTARATGGTNNTVRVVQSTFDAQAPTN
ncbi:MAG: PilX N-terminal domain-containing pilus assembly protein [Pseudomonadota bacterium]